MKLIQNVTVHPITKPEFVGDILVIGSKISKMGKDLQVEGGQCQKIDGTGLHAYPGFIDVHTHLGLYDEGTGWAGNDANETMEALTPHIRAIDGVYPLDVAFQDAIRAGVTAAHVMPGSANVIGGLTSVIKTFGKHIDKMIIRREAGLKIALGENPKKIHSNKEGSMTRMGIMGLLREEFTNVQLEMKNNDLTELRKISIGKALKREIPVRIHAHRADDIITATRLAEEFNLDLRIEHCTEGHLISDEISEVLEKNGLQVSIGPTMTRRSKIELKNKSWKVYNILTQRGVGVSITTDHPYVPIQYLNVAAALSVREGLDEAEALKGITINPAKNLGVDDRVGSLEVGKDADIVLWNMHPFHYMAKPQMTIINGEIVYEEEK